MWGCVGSNAGFGALQEKQTSLPCRVWNPDSPVFQAVDAPKVTLRAWTASIINRSKRKKTFRHDSAWESAVELHEILTLLFLFNVSFVSGRFYCTMIRRSSVIARLISLDFSCWLINIFFFIWRNSPQWATASSFTRFLDHTQRRTTVGRTPVGERSDQRRDLYLTAHNTHNRQTFMPPVGFEPTITAGERPQTPALDRAATGTGTF